MERAYAEHFVDLVVVLGLDLFGARGYFGPVSLALFLHLAYSLARLLPMMGDFRARILPISGGLGAPVGIVDAGFMFVDTAVTVVVRIPVAEIGGGAAAFPPGVAVAG
jgi:hypothetical protein